MNPQVDAARAAVLARPGDPAAHFALAQALDRVRDPNGALDSLAATLRLAPDHAPALNLRGLVLAERGDVDAAIASFTLAVRSQPGHARAHNNLGNSLRAAGRVAEAESAFAEAVRIQPDYQLAHHNLGAVRQALGRHDDAAAAFAASVRLAAQFRPSWTGLAAVHREQGRLDDAIAACRHAIALDPGASRAERLMLAELLTEAGLDRDARQVYAEALAAHPDSLPAALGFHLGLPQIYADTAAVDAAREAFADGLAALERDFDRTHAPLDAAATLEAWRWSNFFLAYQGRDDRELQARYAALPRRAIAGRLPQWRAPPAAPPRGDGRIRVGFASAFFSDSTVGQYFGRWITELPRERFEAFVYRIGGRHDAVTDAIARRADRLRSFAGAEATIMAIAETIRSDAPHILVYPEVGMDTRCMVLAALRLAPVQCAGWGHPVTTGHDTIDWFFSAGAMERDDADGDYTERLVRLPGIGTSYPRPAIDGLDSAAGIDAARNGLRARLGLAVGAPLFLCPQALFKILPDDDALFARVLAAVPGSVLLVFEGRHRAVTGQYLQRLAATAAAHGVTVPERVRVLSRMARADFLRVNAACDAMLDTLHWSGGNTSLDAIAAGLPIVSLPGASMRARQSGGMLRLIGVDELVARDTDDYVRIAARLAADRPWRDAIAARVRADGARLFDDAAPLAALADFFAQAARAGQPG